MLSIVSNISIGKRLSAGFFLVLLCAAVLFALGLWRMGQLQQGVEILVKGDATRLANATDMRQAAWSMALSLRKAVTPSYPAESTNEMKKLASTMEAYEAAERTLAQLPANEQGRQALAAAMENKLAIFRTIEQIKALIKEDRQYDGANVVKKDFLPLHEKWLGSLGALVEVQKQDMKAAYQESDERYRYTRMDMIVVGIVTLALGMLIAWFITRTITTPLREAGGWRDGDFPEDWELWLRLLEAGHHLSCVPRVLHRWRDGDARATRRDARYALEKHLTLKADYLARRFAHTPVTLWGATDTGRALSRLLTARGCRVVRFVELNPRKLGQTIHGVPVIHPDALPDDGSHLVSCVAAKGAREEIRGWMTKRGKVELKDFTCAA